VQEGKTVIQGLTNLFKNCWDEGCFKSCNQEGGGDNGRRKGGKRRVQKSQVVLLDGKKMVVNYYDWG